MKYSLRSLMIAAILGPPLLAGGWYLGNRLLAKPSALLEEVRDSANGSLLDITERERRPKPQAPAPKPPND